MSEQKTGAPVEESPEQVPPEQTELGSRERAAPRRLYRSRQDRMIGGVCGGLGQYFDVDPVIVRLIFLLLLFSGPGILAYIVLMIVVPERPLGETEPTISSSFDANRGRQVVALILIGFGLVLLADNLRLYRIADLGQFWPIVLIVAGALILVSRNRQS